MSLNRAIVTRVMLPVPHKMYQQKAPVSSFTKKVTNPPNRTIPLTCYRAAVVGVRLFGSSFFRWKPCIIVCVFTGMLRLDTFIRKLLGNYITRTHPRWVYISQYLMRRAITWPQHDTATGDMNEGRRNECLLFFGIRLH